jgi:hypothetical protein
MNRNNQDNMKSITTIMLTLLAASLLSSCDRFIGKQNPPSIDPVTILEVQVSSERHLRAKRRRRRHQPYDNYE